MGNQQAAMAGHYHLPAPVSSSSQAHQAKPAEPLESYIREQQRDEHLKNLGFKRSKSLRKSIAKRLRKKHKRKGHPDEPMEGGGANRRRNSDLDSVNTDKDQDRKSERIPSIEKLNLNEYPEPHRRHRPLVGEPEPLPSHVQELDLDRPGATARRMDRLRRSLRSSLRRKNKDKHNNAESLRQQQQQGLSTTDGKGGENAGSSGSTKTHQWQSDEVAVRSGTCSFQVKYLGCVEVFESRGMQVCEEAVKVLKNSKRKSVRAILYVHGDGLRVVDDDTKGLIVDQTIEKVSFCAPDRNFERGFSYICRDGTTRRWMCHGFMAVKESGERLSHAVGCAFAICLEKKQQRDKLCTVSMTIDQSNSSFTRFGSFRQPSLTERLQDPQVVKPSHEPIPLENVENPFAVARPHATDSMIQRQTSFRGFSQLQNSPFKRNLSLRLNELPSTLARQHQEGVDLGILGLSEDKNAMHGSATASGDLERVLGLDNSGLEDIFKSDTKNGTGANPQVQNLKNQISHLYQLSDPQIQGNHFSEPAFDSIAEVEDETLETTPSDPISSMCQQLSMELFNMSNNNKSDNAVTPTNLNHNNTHNLFQDEMNNQEESQQFHSLPYIPTSPFPKSNIDVQHQQQPPRAQSSVSQNNTSKSSEDSADPLANVKPVHYDNPWDFVPDQPNKVLLQASSNNSVNNIQPNGSSQNCDSSSSGVSSTSSNNVVINNTNPNNVLDDDWNFPSQNHLQADFNNEDNNTNDDEDISAFKKSSNDFWSSAGDSDNGGVLADPFDAEWAALATRNHINNVTNPFISESDDNQDTKPIKAFELQM